MVRNHTKWIERHGQSQYIPELFSSTRITKSGLKGYTYYAPALILFVSQNHKKWIERSGIHDLTPRAWYRNHKKWIERFKI